MHSVPSSQGNLNHPLAVLLLYCKSMNSKYFFHENCFNTTNKDYINEILKGLKMVEMSFGYIFKMIQDYESSV